MAGMRPAPAPGDAMDVAVMVVDDQAAFRRVARAVIDATRGFEHVGAAASGPDALRDADALHPDLVLMDVHMPDMDGFEAAHQIKRDHPRCVVVLLSLERLEELDGTGLAACGAAAFLPKQALGPASLRGLWAAHRPARQTSSD